LSAGVAADQRPVGGQRPVDARVYLRRSDGDIEMPALASFYAAGRLEPDQRIHLAAIAYIGPAVPDNKLTIQDRRRQNGAILSWSGLSRASSRRERLLDSISAPAALATSEIRRAPGPQSAGMRNLELSA
jgi:hypothetical protein